MTNILSIYPHNHWWDWDIYPSNIQAALFLWRRNLDSVFASTHAPWLLPHYHIVSIFLQSVSSISKKNEKVILCHIWPVWLTCKTFPLKLPQELCCDIGFMGVGIVVEEGQTVDILGCFFQMAFFITAVLCNSNLHCCPMPQEQNLMEVNALCVQKCYQQYLPTDCSLGLLQGEVMNPHFIAWHWWKHWWSGNIPCLPWKISPKPSILWRNCSW